MKNIAILTCDYEEYSIEVEFIVPCPNINEVERFVSSYIVGIALSRSDIRIIAKRFTVPPVIFTNFQVMKLKEECVGEAFVDAEKDYVKLNYDFLSLHTQLCLKYGQKESFLFENVCYAVKEC